CGQPAAEESPDFHRCKPCRSIFVWAALHIGYFSTLKRRMYEVSIAYLLAEPLPSQHPKAHPGHSYDCLVLGRRHGIGPKRRYANARLRRKRRSPTKSAPDYFQFHGQQSRGQLLDLL